LTADKKMPFEILDAFVDFGFNLISECRIDLERTKKKPYQERGTGSLKSANHMPLQETVPSA